MVISIPDHPADGCDQAGRKADGTDAPKVFCGCHEQNYMARGSLNGLPPSPTSGQWMGRGHWSDGRLRYGAGSC